jgi:cation:H+ antiporter
MSLLISSSLIIVGFLFLIKGADWMVNGASSLAKKYNISDLAIGLTIVAFGTSAPELVVNSIASFDHQSDIVFGNVIGSNNFNLFVILGIVGLIFPIAVQSTTVWKEIPISLIAALGLFILANGFLFQGGNILSRFDGLLLFLLFLLFLFYVYKQLKTDESKIETTNAVSSNLKIWGYIVIGLIGLIIGGKLVVDNAIEIATDFGVSKKIIGLTIIAAGTSLPELVTSVVAAFKKNSDIAIGNIIGSNIFNILFILSISSFINPIEYNIAFNTDIYLLIGGTIFLFIAMFTGEKKKLDRWEAGILLAVFIGYTIYLIGKEI